MPTPSASGTPTSGAPARNPGRGFTIAALVLAGLGLAMFPLGGLVGVVCATGHANAWPGLVT